MKKEDEKNEFSDLSVEDDIPEQKFDAVPEGDETELMANDLMREPFIKNPKVGESIVLNVLKVVDNKRTKGTNKTTGDEFDIGVKKKDGSVIRRDIKTSEGSFTVSSWELFYKLFGNDSVLLKYAKEHNNSFKGAVIKITKNYNGNHAMREVEELEKLLDKTPEEAKAYKAEVAKAQKESRLFTVELMNV